MRIIGDVQLPFYSRLIRRIGIDLGTTTVRIWTDEAGLVVTEPSLIAVEERSKKVVAVGSDAAAMVGRVGGDIVVHQPIQAGRVYDLDTARALLKVLLQRATPRFSLFNPVIMISVPAGSTTAVRQAATELAYSLGAREAYTISQPLAAAIGAGVPVADASGTFLLQFGGGVVEGAIISLGSMVKWESSERGGEWLDRRLQQHVRRASGLITSASTVSDLKQVVVSLRNGSTRERLVAGQDHTTNAPKEVAVTAQDLAETTERWFEDIQGLVQRLLSQVPAELAVDVIDKGMLLSGGLAQMDGLADRLISAVGVSVALIDEPDTAVIKGIGTALEHIDLFKRSLGYRSAEI